jgi:outer membrane protein OmpA-like peptidoglycan-associated protein
VRRALALAAGLWLGAAAGAAPAETASSTSETEVLRITERSDFSRYLDGRYLGHAYREARGALVPNPDGKGFEGDFLVLEETLRDDHAVSRQVDQSVPASLAVLPGGAFDLRVDSGYPSLRACPSFPEDYKAGRLEKGEAWTAPGVRALDFEDSGSFVLLPFLAEYRCRGLVDFQGRQALSLSAKFATRWSSATRAAPIAQPVAPIAQPAADRPVSELISKATGTHDLDILVDPETLSPIFIRDRFDETFELAAGGGSERRSGFTLYFYNKSPGLDQGKAAQAIVAAVAAAGQASTPAAPPAASRGDAATPPPLAAGSEDRLPPGAGPGPLDAGPASPLADGGSLAAAGLELGSSPEGLVLRVKDLRFVADSDQILGSELWRLDAIAAALKSLPGRTFLVAGHSAAVGKAAGELELSIRRAKKVTEELAARGIDASRLLYRGFGSSLPLAGNDTEEGRAKNRRVEITVLD